MDLALALGQPYRALARSMPEGEFQDWQTYAARRMLPQRRLELYLAQIAFLIDRALGGAKNRGITDYLFDPAGAEPDAEPTAEEEAAFFGFNPRVKD